MLDEYGRSINYIRVSVTDRCNLRCTYCMPEEGVEQVSHSDILSYDEIARVIRLCAERGISRVKLTGGEPLVRRGLPSLVETLKQIPGIEQVTLTTNGVLLKEQMGALAGAGIDAVNISIDTLDQEMYAHISRRDKLADALSGLEEALKYREVKVKINCVPLLGVNEYQWVPLSLLAKEKPVDVRFIEMMPIGYGKKYQGKTQEDILSVLREAYGEERCSSGVFGNGPSTYVEFPGFRGKIGFISAMSHKFCSECNRVRLTSEGLLKPCLQYAAGEDLRTPLRRGASEDELSRLIGRAIYHKPLSHHFEMEEGEGFEEKQMSRIGG